MHWAFFVRRWLLWQIVAFSSPIYILFLDYNTNEVQDAWIYVNFWKKDINSHFSLQYVGLFSYTCECFYRIPTREWSWLMKTKWAKKVLSQLTHVSLDCIFNFAFAQSLSMLWVSNQSISYQNVLIWDRCHIKQIENTFPLITLSGLELKKDYQA